MKRIYCPGCGGKHDSEANSGKGCGERRAVVKGSDRRQVMRVLWILAVFVAVIGLIACQEHTIQQKELQEAITTVLKGQGVSQTTAYDKDRPRPPRLVLVTRSGKPHEWSSSLPAEWIAKTVSEMALVVVVEDEEVTLDSQKYNIGPSITRYRHDLRLEVRVAQTGILLDEFTVKGETPRAFPQTAPMNQAGIDGRRVEFTQFAEALRQLRLVLVRLNTSGPVGRKETNPIGMTFLELGPGSFKMGSDSGVKNEWPVHRVTISRVFQLQTTEVTQGQWKAVMGNNPSRFKNGDDYPVEQVSWNDVQVFLQKLNALDPEKNYRLPTEAEWEYACRAGTTGERYGELDAIAWYRGNSGGQTHPVGQKQPNAWGLYDMLGNVREWCADWYDENYYADSPAWDPQGPSSGKSRVLRGGSRFDDGSISRRANRYGVNPDYRDYDYCDFGFRCARD